MKRLGFLLMAILLVVGAKAQTVYESGVSLELAQHRAATIKNLAYDLSFNIPEDPSADNEANEIVSFTLQSKQEIALDFRELPGKIHSVSIDGKKKQIAWRFENEHIVIPAEYTKKGNNAFRITFTAGKQSLNRSEEYMYTLFVPDRARTCFPCFDQPDLKAKFTLSLKVPRGWKAVSNSPLVSDDNGIMNFAQSEMLPTYLFAFAAGKFQYQEYSCTLPLGGGSGRGSYGGSGRGLTIGAYYRETDPVRIKQLPEIFRQVHFALQWLEDFTGQPYGFSKYDFVVLPGFQFGGMEHTGATFYNDNTLFLSPNPTQDEILSRANLIAHETAHMWFGDLVTMRWFNDVWTKEVFANYFAAEINHPQFPDVNYDLYWLKNFKQAAVTEDRTDGRTAIQQSLDNLRNAGLVYNNIIYNKAPLVMREIVRMMGEEAFRRGIQRYVHDFAYGNATWDDLVDILDAETPVDIKGYSDQWVKQPNYPTIIADSSRPNPTGREYGFFSMSQSQIEELMASWASEQDATAKQSFLMTLYENYLAGGIAHLDWMRFLINELPSVTDPLTLSTMISYMREPIWNLDAQSRAEVEASLWELAQNHPLKAAQLQLIRFLSANGNADETNKQMYVLWRYAENDLLSTTDYMSMAYELALRYPTLASDIITEEHDRVIDPDRQRQFEYISRAVSPDPEACDSLFRWLLIPENRRIEPWAGSALYYLNHPLRDVESSRFIRPALEALQEVQRTGDIFFPGRWCNSLLSGHRSPEASHELEDFITAHPDYPQLLKNKILVASFGLTKRHH